MRLFSFFSFLFALLAASVSTVLADDIVTIFMHISGDNLKGKEIGNDGTLTTYVVDCKSRSSNGFFENGECQDSVTDFTIGSGPSTFYGVYDYLFFKVEEACSFTQSDNYSCVMTLSNANTSYSQTVTAGVPVSYVLETLTVTATESGTGSATARAPDTATAATATATPTSSATDASSSEAGAATTGNQTSNMAFAQTTGQAKWALGAAAAMVLGMI